MTHTVSSTPTHGELSAAISNAVVATFRSHLGKGPERARTVLDDNMAVTVLRGGFTGAERALMRNGHGDVVGKGRSAMQQLMRDELVSAVEGITGRTVEAFVSAVGDDNEIQAEIFVFAPDLDR